MTIMLVIGVVLLILFLYFRFKSSQQIPILKISIGTTDNKKYLVSFQNMHPEVKPIEYVRLILHFIPKMLYAIMPDDIEQKDAVLDFVTKVSQTSLEPKEVEDIINDKISVYQGNPTGLGITTGTLYFVDSAKRSISTELPKMPKKLYDRHFENIVIAVLCSCNLKLDELHREFLKDYLSYIVQAYSSGQADSSSLKSVMNLANEAFIVARYV